MCGRFLVHAVRKVKHFETNLACGYRSCQDLMTGTAGGSPAHERGARVKDSHLRCSCAGEPPAVPIKTALIPLSKIQDARRVIANFATRTPLVRLDVPDTTAEIYLKLENLQPIGSFKIRGAANAIF